MQESPKQLGNWGVQFCDFECFVQYSELNDIVKFPSIYNYMSR